jgi:hypothetical protein
MLNNANQRCFVAVVQTQSFTSAARQFRLAPSSVSKHVRLIEREAMSLWFIAPLDDSHPPASLDGSEGMPHRADWLALAFRLRAGDVEAKF